MAPAPRAGFWAAPLEPSAQARSWGQILEARGEAVWLCPYQPVAGDAPSLSEIQQIPDRVFGGEGLNELDACTVHVRLLASALQGHRNHAGAAPLARGAAGALLAPRNPTVPLGYIHVYLFFSSSSPENRKFQSPWGCF